MPRKGRLVQPRHIFPWIAAPYIEMLRILWRIEGFFLLPVKYLKAWTVSAIFGVMGVCFAIALFIPRLTETQAQASPDLKTRQLISPYDLPIIPDEQLVLPTQNGKSHLTIQFQRLNFRESFNQNELITIRSHAPLRRSAPITSWETDSWRRYRNIDNRIHEQPIDSYVFAARVWRDFEIPEPQEYVFDPQTAGSQHQAARTPTLLIEKHVPNRLTPHEPLISIITVTNTGREPVESAIVEESITDITRVVDTSPHAMRSADSKKLIWNLDKLQPGETRELKLTIQPDSHHNLTHTTEVALTSAPVIAETMIRERSVDPAEPEIVPESVKRPVSAGKPQLVVQFEPPRTVKVGEEVEAFYTITNVGSADATGIRLLVEVPVNLRHRFGELVEHKIARLAPNESRRALFAALAEGAGRMSLNWTLESNELPNQSDAEWLSIAAAPAPSISTVPSASPGPIRSSIPPQKSSIPRQEPALLAEPELPTPADTPAIEQLPAEIVPAEDPAKSLTPSLSSDVPPAAFGSGPGGTHSSIPNSSIPTWTSSNSVPESLTPSDPTATEPMLPEFAPDESPTLNTPELLPGEPIVPSVEAPASPSSIPPGNGTDVIKAE